MAEGDRRGRVSGGETCPLERPLPPVRLEWAVCPSQETPGRRTVRGEATPPIGYSACSGQINERHLQFNDGLNGLSRSFMGPELARFPSRPSQSSVNTR